MATIFKTLSVIKNPVKSFVGFIESSVSVLKFCTKQRLIAEGGILHGHFYKLGIASNRHVSIKLLIMYLDFRKSAEVDQLLKDYDGFDMIVHNCLISANVDWGNVDDARKLFDEMPERNEVSWTALISGYLKCGRVDESMELFRRNPFQNVISWTAAISGLLLNGMHSKSAELFLEMLRSGVTPNVVTFVSIIRACAEMGKFEWGIAVFGLAVKVGFADDVSVCNSLITFSLRLRKMEMAANIFERMGEKDVISWTAILGMYVEMGDLQEARKVFDEMPERNEVSWSAMISRYSQQGYAEEAFELFRQMVEKGISPNSSCLSSTINGLANVKVLQVGRNVHAHVVKIGMANNVFVSSSLIDLYGSCGKTSDGRLVFDTVPDKNVVLWNTMISAYSLDGQLEEANKLFDQIPVKSIGSWNSMVSGYLRNEQHDKVFEVFNDMMLSGQKPDISTFSTAEALMMTMPCEPEVNAWAALLSGCKTYGEDEVAERTAVKIRDVAEKKSGGYVLLSNVYALAGKWPEVMETRKLMKERGLKKNGGCSWIEVKNELNLFYSQDGSRIDSNEIYGVLELLNST
ncbi:Pentatricopeptide repeat-containing protein [Cynara cardunculus var. scolymus]|uniref:Pentatricopeptide repeat-containing protein n=1 Tax=Cynara cardunculus var. scolymus TaxID=59895 RepID=A0A103Y4N5_CYNCS|nr:Pentatricopeptide repeat-containing protein [Cynara cardunculus var. scolymus]